MEVFSWSAEEQAKGSGGWWAARAIATNIPGWLRKHTTAMHSPQDRRGNLELLISKILF